MVFDGEQINRALENDENLLEAAAGIYRSSVQSLNGCLPGAEYEAAAHAMQIGRCLYGELDLLLHSPQEWSGFKAAQIGESRRSGEYIAALALLAHKVHAAPGSAGLPELSGKAAVSQAHIEEAAALLSRTPMTGMFDMLQDFPCLSDERVRRLSVLLGMTTYCKWLEQDASLLGKIHPDVLMDAMLGWGFAFAEMMCSAAGEKKDERYAQAVSLIACANLPRMIRFDNWKVLRLCVESMCACRDDFYEVLCGLTQALEDEPGEHIRIAEMDISGHYEEKWLHLLDCLTETEKESVGEENEPFWESLEDPRRETESDHDFE